MSLTKKIHFLFFFFTITIGGISFSQTAPIANNDSNIAELNLTLTVSAPGVLNNDTDADGDTLSIISFVINGTTYNAGETANLPQGNFTLNTNGGYIFSPAVGYVGNYPNINYTITDGTFTSSAFLNLSVQNTTNLNPPTTNRDVDTADINTTLTVDSTSGLLTNDTDADGDTLSISQFMINGSIYIAGSTANLASGNLTINTDGSYTFAPTPGYIGPVPDITYFAFDGYNTTPETFLLTVEPTTNLIEIESLSSCNQGYTVDGEYKIRYQLRLRNRSNARDYHTPSMVSQIDILDDLNIAFGNGCPTLVDNVSIGMPDPPEDFVNNPYPADWTTAAFNSDFGNITSTSFFSANAIANNILYPRQTLSISFCVTVDPFCDGRPNPTPSGSGIDFDNSITINSSTDTVSTNSVITDMHTSEAIVTANFYVPEPTPDVNPDGSYDYVNTVIITNEGTETATNVNYNMGLGDFIDNGIIFTTTHVTQVIGAPVAINTNYNGDSDTKLLMPNVSLAPGETITLEVFYEIGVISSIDENYFPQTGRSTTQGPLDSHDETLASELRRLSFVTWSDTLGDHLDRYYTASSPTEVASSTEQCVCSTALMIFNFTSSVTTEKQITETTIGVNGIPEHTEVTFQLTITNTSPAVQVESLQLQDNLNNICPGSIVSTTTPTIVSSTALQDPTLDTNFDGIFNIEFFDGISGILEPNQTLTLEFTVLFNEDCIGNNDSYFSAIDPLSNPSSASATAPVSIFSDNDNDGISNVNDIDDDNDTVPDIIEYNGQDPLADNDNDFIPNYRDPNFGADSNNDGIIDLFDFDLDGIPNHFDLDSDNDGIFDIAEINNASLDIDSDGITNNLVSLNGLDDTVETNDSFFANITYVIQNTDATGYANYLDIDADDDGIVDNIEAQPTDNYLTPDEVVDTFGVDTAYTSGLSPVDTEGDGIPDYVDTNSDGDIRDDIIEGWDTDSDGTPETTPSNADSDGDGLDNAFDQDDSQINPTNGQVPTDFPNADNANTPERDWRELIAINVIIDNVSVTEGGDLIFTISLVTLNNSSIFIQSATPIDITLNTSDGTTTTSIYDVAVAPFDYNASVGIPLIIPPLQTTIQYTVPTLEDTIYELDELLTLTGSITSNNTINTEFNGVGTILDNETPPDITMNDTRENEGIDLVHTINLSHPSSTPVIIDLVTSDITATASLDYDAIIAILTIDGTVDQTNANTFVTFNISTILDNLNEPDLESLSVIGTVRSNNVSIQDLNKIGEIIDIDPDPMVIINDPIVVEGQPLLFEISLVNPTTGEPMQNYQHVNLDVQSNNNTAFAPLDYTSFSSTLSIPAFTESITIEITTIDDRLNEDTEFMNLLAVILSNNTFNNPQFVEGLGTIKDNDIPNLFSPNGDGRSDEFRIAGLQDFPEFEIVIYDRWGSEIFNYSNNGNVNPLWWDGTNNGNPVPAGVYYFTLNYNDGITKPKTSFVELIR